MKANMALFQIYLTFSALANWWTITETKACKVNQGMSKSPDDAFLKTVKKILFIWIYFFFYFRGADVAAI